MTFSKFRYSSPTLKKLDVKYFSKIGTTQSKTVPMSVLGATKLIFFIVFIIEVSQLIENQDINSWEAEVAHRTPLSCVVFAPEIQPDYLSLVHSTS